MTSATTSSADSGLFDTPFSIGAAVVALLCFLVGIFMAWTGYQGGTLPVAGTELNIVTGMAGLMITAFFGVVALFAAIYMEPGFDH
ncbi:hypothetical protein [Halopiger aswanensis]|uniref:Uncharacterized protein n=1 Tax=Halopiger aswanensis TaxID=148449 RepID=A0A419WGR6_9EURY|nr:hypothetical protein [Halopiger aswanensis]RKD94623.1 hypothetical protein ATJ93_1458 [Halopiger aswanensis]